MAINRIFATPSGWKRNDQTIKIFENFQTISFSYSVSMTTRAQRRVKGWCRLFFRTREEFEDLIRQGQMLEYAGTLKLLWDSFNLCE